MAEKVFIKQNSTFETEILIYNAETRRYQPTEQLQDVTPYGMLLVSLGLCTSAVLYAYAIGFEKSGVPTVERSDLLRQYREKLTKEGTKSLMVVTGR
ncbi:MAG TPA: hypothetical protein DCP92_16495 [Nitrospiraceae bacterium]|jgi:hypothetical protein|nr:hypothetical protein [Nitrospiraceae bacterium]